MGAVAACGAFTRRRRLGGLGLAPSGAVALIPTGIAALIAWRGAGTPLDDYQRYAAPLCLSFVLPFVAMFTTLPILGELYDKGAMGYVYTRPAPRWAPLLGLFQGALLAMLPVMVLSALGPALVMMLLDRGATGIAEWLPAVGGVAAALTVGTVVDTAICVLLGVWSRRSILWALLVLVVWGSVVGNLPGSLRDTSPHRYLTALLRQWGNIDPQVDLIVLPVDPEPPSAGVALAALGATTVLCLFLSWRASRRRDIL